jgi:hypothetical protein
VPAQTTPNKTAPPKQAPPKGAAAKSTSSNKTADQTPQAVPVVQKPSKLGSPETIKTPNAPARKPAASQRPKPNQPATPRPATPHDEGEDEFWKYVGE